MSLVIIHYMAKVMRSHSPPHTHTHAAIEREKRFPSRINCSSPQLFGSLSGDVNKVIRYWAQERGVDYRYKFESC